MPVLTLNSFENALADVNRKAGAKADFYVLNCHKQLRAVVDGVLQPAISSSSSGILNGIDLRPVYVPQGNPVNWSLEACSQGRSLAITGKSPTA